MNLLKTKDPKTPLPSFPPFSRREMSVGGEERERERGEGGFCAKEKPAPILNYLISIDRSPLIRKGK